MSTLSEKAKQSAKKSRIAKKAAKKAPAGGYKKTGMVADIEKMLKAGKTVPEVAKKYNKPNRAIGWYVNYLRKRDRLPKNLPRKTPIQKRVAKKPTTKPAAETPKTETAA